MTERKWLKIVYKFLASAFLAGELAVLADIAALWLGKSLSVMAFAAIGAGVLLACFLFPRFTGKGIAAAAAGILSAAVLTVGALALCWNHFGQWASYQRVDSGKEQLFADRNIMVLVPHQDDELNILGGALEEYVRYGSRIDVVFVTNGDYENLAQTRFREALDVCSRIGIPEENVTFLGYGDTWAEDGPHIYNAQPGEVMVSYNGRTETYGTAVRGVYREGRAYTIDNLLEDLESIILEKRPDVLFCNDYDRHIDHKALSLSFEKVMGKILKESETYRPLVFKGYAYMSAWYAPYDFYGENLASTLNVYEPPCYQSPDIYVWEDRLRLPVDAATLSRSLLQSGAYETLSLYASQEANFHAPGIINGDKVFWYRDTNSLCLDAQLTASSSDPALLQDFMLMDNYNLADKSDMTFDGVWIPENGDTEKCVTVTLAQPSDIHSIVLYDHPDSSKNVLDARIVFDDGTQLQTGPLWTGGAATVFQVEKAGVSSFSIFLTATEGEGAGLTEIEAFREASNPGVKLIKTVDAEDNFVYDYWLPEDGTAEFGFYTYGEVPEVNEENYTVTCSNTACEVTLEDGTLRIQCPAGETAVITISCLKESLSDSIYVQNPGSLARMQAKLCQSVEETLFVGYCEGRHWELATVKILDLAGKLLGIR